jgi:hypothetical protein
VAEQQQSGQGVEHQILQVRTTHALSVRGGVWKARRSLLCICLCLFCAEQGSWYQHGRGSQAVLFRAGSAHDRVQVGRDRG